MGGEFPSFFSLLSNQPFCSRRLTLSAGAVLEEMPPDDEVSSMKFAGSTVMVVAESRQAVIDLLKDDVYVKSGVWDLEKVSCARLLACSTSQST